ILLALPPTQHKHHRHGDGEGDERRIHGERGRRIGLSRVEVGPQAKAGDDGGDHNGHACGPESVKSVHRLSTPGTFTKKPPTRPYPSWHCLSPPAGWGPAAEISSYAPSENADRALPPIPIPRK